MTELKNNLFNYATKELSQDAVICWILNWVNHPDCDFYDLGCDLLQAVNDEYKKVEKIIIHQQKKSADIVVVIPEQQKIIIIEDKVYSSEHDNQIETYKKTFENVEIQRGDLEIKDNLPYKVSTVYFKTGYFYDDDKLVKADCIVDGKKFYDIVSNQKYKGKSEILDYYVAHLDNVIGWYENHSSIDQKYDNSDDYYISWETYRQYLLMRFIFPESKWNKESYAYKVCHGSSGGRPWTELDIIDAIHYSNSEDKYELFWRIDTAKNGPYISFRYYEWMDKSDKCKFERHKMYYEIFRNMAKRVVEIIDNPDINWESVYPGYRGNYKESELLTIKLKGYLDDWDKKKELLAEYVRIFTDRFLEILRDEVISVQN